MVLTEIRTTVVLTTAGEEGYFSLPTSFKKINGMSVCREDSIYAFHGFSVMFLSFKLTSYFHLVQVINLNLFIFIVTNALSAL